MGNYPPTNYPPVNGLDRGRVAGSIRVGGFRVKGFALGARRLRARGFEGFDSDCRCSGLGFRVRGVALPLRCNADH